MKTATAVSLAVTCAMALVIFAGCKTMSPGQAAGIDLFNGTNFDGWTFCMRKNSDPMKTWSVSDGMMCCTGQPYGYARTEQIYHDYKLTCIWRFVKVAPHADNSGIFVHIHLPDKVWPACIECQGQFQHQGDFILGAPMTADGHPAKTKRRIPQMGPPNENPAGEWGTNEVICSGGTIKLYVNGRLMNQLTGLNVTSGYIGIQSEGGDIQVRRLFLEPLE